MISRYTLNVLLIMCGLFLTCKVLGGPRSMRTTAKLNKALAKDPLYPEMLKYENGTYTKSNEEVVDLLMKTHFPGTKPRSQLQNQNARIPNSTDWAIAE